MQAVMLLFFFFNETFLRQLTSKVFALCILMKAGLLILAPSNAAGPKVYLAVWASLGLCDYMQLPQ